MVFINFKMRMKIESLFIEWCEKNGIAKEPNSMVVFMIEKGWLNEEKINKDLHNKALEYYESKRKTENSSGKPNNCEPKICDTCRYYNSYIPCGSTPSACKEADKFAEEFVDGLKKLKPKVEPQIFICPIQDDYEALIEDEPQTERSE